MAFRVLARMLSTPSLLCQPVLDTVVINKTTQCSNVPCYLLYSTYYPSPSSYSPVETLSSLFVLPPSSLTLFTSFSKPVAPCLIPLHPSSIPPQPSTTPTPFQTPNLVCGEVACKMEPEDLDTGKDYKADKKLQRSFMNGQCILVYLRTV